MSSGPHRRTGEIVLYVPADPLAARIPRGSAIVGEPRFGASEVEVYFETGAPQPRGMHTLADRALSASGRMLERAVFGGCLLVPPETLTPVGVVKFTEGSIALTGPQSARAVADWLGTRRLDESELRESGAPLTGHELMGVATSTLVITRLKPGLLRTLLERGGVRADGEGWRGPDGRRTVAIGSALIWALERIAKEC